MAKTMIYQSFKKITCLQKKLHQAGYGGISTICTKVQISKRVLQGNKARQIFQKPNISYPLIHTRTCAYQRERNVDFSENLVCSFLVTPVLRFTLLPYY